MAEDFSNQPSYTPGRRWSAALSIALAIVSLFVILAMANYLSARHFKRVQVGSGAAFNLSPVTMRVLGSLTNKVRITVLFDRTRPLYGMVKELLRQYEFRSGMIEVEYVDYLAQRGRAEQIQAQYKASALEMGDCVLFDSGGRIQVVYENQLSEFDYSGLLQNREIRRTGFKGEQLFTSALYSLFDPRPFKACFVTGHREHNPAGGSSLESYSRFARLLTESGLSWEEISLARTNIPSDCSLLIIAGPETQFQREEVESIQRYLTQGGRMLVLFNHKSVGVRTGPDVLLADWGVEAGDNFVVDQKNQKTQDSQILIDDFGEHQTVSSLRRSRLNFVAPRSISRLPGRARSADAASVTELALTEETATAIRSVSTNRFVPDKTGVISLAVAIERGTIQGVGADRGATRIIAAGDSLFLSDAVIDAEANRAFAANAVNWLVNRDLLLEGISARAIREYKISMTEGELQTARWIMLGGAPGCVLLLGAAAWLRRRI